MARRRYRVVPPSKKRFFAALAALVPAVVLFVLVFGGETYRATNGSEIGMIATMAMLFAALVLTLVGIVCLGLGLIRRHEQALEFQPTELAGKREVRERGRRRAA